MDMQKSGGFGSFVNALLMIFFLLVPFALSDFYDSTKGFDAISASLSTSILVCFAAILSGLAYIPIVLALRERMQDRIPNIMRIAVIGVSIVCALWFAGALIGIVGRPIAVSARDAAAYTAVGAIVYSLFPAGDFALGWILLIIGLASLRSKTLSVILSILFVLKGVAMILSFAVSILGLVGVILGLIFYPWLGIVLFRRQS